MTFNNGDVKPCCDSRRLNSDEKKNLADIWQSKKWNNIRSNIKKDIRSQECQVCWDKEDQGLVSGRDNRDEQLDLLYKCSESGQMNLLPETISLRMGNICNLKCIMCSPMNSTKWYSDLEIYNKYFPEKKILSSYPKFNFDEFKEISKNLKMINFIGGEPLIIKEHQQVINYLITSGLSKKMTLSYSTNITVLPDWCKESWKEFQRVIFKCSIDAVGEKYNYIRSPGNWKLVEENFIKLNNWNLRNVEISILFVLMNINGLGLEELFRWRNSFTWQGAMPEIRPDYLSEPYFLSPHNLVEEDLVNIQQSLSRTIDELTMNDFEKVLLKDMLSQLNLNSSKNIDFNKFKNYIKDLDVKRNFDSQSIFNLKTLRLS